MDRTPIVHKKETLKRCAALGVETGLRGCPLLAYGLWLMAYGFGETTRGVTVKIALPDVTTVPSVI